MANDIINLPDGPDPVYAIAAKIGTLNGDFANKYNSLYSLLSNDLANAWKGDDYDTFRNSMIDEKPRFDKMRDIIDEYSDALLKAVKAHVERMDSTKGDAAAGAKFD